MSTARRVIAYTLPFCRYLSTNSNAIVDRRLITGWWKNVARLAISLPLSLSLSVSLVKRRFDREEGQEFKSKTFNERISRFPETKASGGGRKPEERRGEERRGEGYSSVWRARANEVVLYTDPSASVRRTPKFYGRVYARPAIRFALVGELIWSFVPHRNPWKEIYARAHA